MSYETPEDRAAEWAVLLLYCGTDRYPVRTKGMSVYDAVIVRKADDVPLEVAEVKVRKESIHTYPTLTVDVAKVEALRTLARERNVPAVLLVAWSDAVCVLDLPERSDWPVKPQTRRDRPEAGPRPVYHIPTDQFRGVW